MTSPFPGMDPFLEHRSIWPDVHNGLIAELRNALGPALRPRYYVSLEERACQPDPDDTVFASQPDPDPGRETYLEVRSVDSDEVVTVLELLSPANKRPGAGRALYENKRTAILGTLTHLVEVDLVRIGNPMPMVGPDLDSDYRILICRGDQRPNARLHAFSVRQPIPTFDLPLRRGDEAPRVDLGGLFGKLYENASYDLRVDYQGDPPPPLRPEDGDWMLDLLRSEAN